MKSYFFAFGVALCTALPAHSQAKDKAKPLAFQAILSKKWNGEPQQIANRFKPTDRTFHLTLRFNRPSHNDRIKTAWIISDAGGVKNYRFAEKTLLTKRMDSVHFATSLQKNWPRGKYRADVFVNNVRMKQVYFVVQ